MLRVVDTAQNESASGDQIIAASGLDPGAETRSTRLTLMLSSVVATSGDAIR
jgi:hypothetical protein